MTFIFSDILKLYPWQCQVLELPNVLLGRNLVYSAPTSGGKTLGMLIWGGWLGNLKRVVCYFEEGGVLIWICWYAIWIWSYAILKRENVLLGRNLVCSAPTSGGKTLGMLIWRGWLSNLKRVGCYFEEGGIHFWRGWCGILKRTVC